MGGERLAAGPRYDALVAFHPLKGEKDLVCIALSITAFKVNLEGELQGADPMDSVHSYPLDGLPRKPIGNLEEMMVAGSMRRFYVEVARVSPAELESGKRTFPDSVYVHEGTVAIRETNIPRTVNLYQRMFEQQLEKE